MQDRAWSTFATLPLARAKARRVNSASGLTQQLNRGKETKKNKYCCHRWKDVQTIKQIKNGVFTTLNPFLDLYFYSVCFNIIYLNGLIMYY